MNFFKLESYARLLAVIQTLKQELTFCQSGLKASSIDGGPSGKAYKNDPIGELVIKKDLILDRLPKLEELERERSPEVIKTINDIIKINGKGKIKLELILNMRYLQGFEWEEIAATLETPEREIQKMVNTAMNNYSMFGDEE